MFIQLRNLESSVLMLCKECDCEFVIDMNRLSLPVLSITCLNSDNADLGQNTVTGLQSWDNSLYQNPSIHQITSLAIIFLMSPSKDSDHVDGLIKWI